MEITQELVFTFAIKQEGIDFTFSEKGKTFEEARERLSKKLHLAAETIAHSTLPV